MGYLKVLFVFFLLNLCLNDLKAEEPEVCQFITASYISHNDAYKGLQFMMTFTFGPKGHSIIAIPTILQMPTTPYKLKVTVYREEVMRPIYVNNTVCKIDIKNLLPCILEFNPKSNPDHYQFEVINEIGTTTTFFEADLNITKNLIVLPGVFSVCSNDITFKIDAPLDSTIEYCVCCGASMPFDISSCQTQPHPHFSTTGFVTMAKKTSSPINDTVWAPYKIDCELPADQMQRVYCDRSMLDATTIGSFLNKTINAFDAETAKGIDIFMLSHILDKAATVNDIVLTDTTQMYNIYDKMLNVEDKHFEIANTRGPGSTKRILSSIDGLLKNANYSLEMVHSPNLAFKKYKDEGSCKERVGFADYGKGFGWSEEGKKPLASIEIPSEIACPDKGQPPLPLFYVIYRKTQLFTPTSDIKNLNGDKMLMQFERDTNEDEDDDSRIAKQLEKKDRCKKGLLSQNNRVLSAVLMQQGDKNGINGDKVMARLNYRKDQVRTSLHGKQAVTWWDGQEWTSDGRCKLRANGDFYEADCYHLTDFTILIDGTETDPALCDVSLSIFGIVLNVASLVSLFILALLQSINLIPPIKNRLLPFFYKFPWLKFRVETLTFQYTITLFLFFLFFTVFIDQNRTGGRVGCHVFAGFSYFLLISCILLTLFQAWRVLKLFSWSSSMDNAFKFVARDDLVFVGALVIPLLVCVIGFLADHKFYNREDNYCWIRPTNVIFAVVIPLTILVINGLFCSIIIINRLYPSLHITAPLRRLIRTNSTMIAKATKKKSQRRFLVILNMQFMLGLPWILQYLTLFAPSATAWHYIFTLANGSQGIVLFAMFIYKRFQFYRQLSKNATPTIQHPSEMISTTIPATLNEQLKGENDYEEIKDNQNYTFIRHGTE